MANGGAAGAQGNRRATIRSSTPKPTSTTPGGSGLPAPAKGGASSGLPAPTGGRSMTGAAAGGTMQKAQTRETKKASTLLMDSKRVQELSNNIAALDGFINHQHMAALSSCSVPPLSTLPSDRSAIQMYELTKLMLSETEDTYEKLVSMYASLHSMQANIGIILHSNKGMLHFYLCVSCNDDGAAASLLYNGITGHFPGSRLEKKKDTEVEAILQALEKMPAPAVNGRITENKYIQALSIIPSRRTEEKENKNLRASAQGIEKFIDGMTGKDYMVFFLAQPLLAQAIDQCKRGFESLYTLLSPFAKETVSYSENESDATNYSLSINMSESISEGISSSYGTSHTTGKSGSKGGSQGTGAHAGSFGFNSGSCWNTGWNTSDGTTNSTSTTTGTQKSKGDSEQNGDSHTTGSSRTVNLTREIKMVQNSMQRLDAEIQRIETNRGFGMWNCCCYVVADDMTVTSTCASSLHSLLSGDAAYGGSSYINSWNCHSQRQNAANFLTSISYMCHPQLLYQPVSGSSVAPQMITPAMMVSGRDLPTLLNLPRRSVSGVQVTTMAEFGRNFPREFKPRRPMRFGNVMHMGRTEKTEMLFDLDRFSSHCFICGASGSGKSNTTYNLLQEFYTNGIPFLVIEPAKGEYKMEFAGMPGMQIFTCKPDNFRMLAINPFEFHRSVHIKEHLDHLNSVVTTCWPLYGPMPAMLKEAFEEAYIACGWDLELSERVLKVGKEFPTFADVLPAIERIIDNSTYSAEARGDYKGALCMRIRMLMTGFEGMIFDHTWGVSDAELFNQNTVVDLSNIGNPETRALIMGMLIIKLREYRFATHTATNSQLKHITVLEEAHNILKRCSHETSQDSGNVQGAAVGALVACIAELRSCGEGFLIIDQSPGAVDEAALKNTAIKIAMRLPEKSDCEAIGNTMGLTEEQMRELTRFDKGVAAVFHEGWEEAVLGKMGTIWAATPHAKLYKTAPPPLNRTDLLRAKGAVCQWLCSLFLSGDLNELENMSSFDSFVRRFRAENYTPSLNDHLWKDIRLQMYQLLSEISENIGEDLLGLVTDEKVLLKQFLGSFMRKFLQIDGIFRLCPLVLSDYRAENELMPSAKQLAQIKAWWKKCENVWNRYMLVPVRRHAKPLQWSSDVLSCEYAKKILLFILFSYGKDYEKTHSGNSMYSCLYFALQNLYLK